jgi:hypothetical protein
MNPRPVSRAIFHAKHGNRVFLCGEGLRDQGIRQLLLPSALRGIAAHRRSIVAAVRSNSVSATVQNKRTSP